MSSLGSEHARSPMSTRTHLTSRWKSQALEGVLFRRSATEESMYVEGRTGLIPSPCGSKIAWITADLRKLFLYNL